jgi:phosphatidylinositol-3-phosphatase
MRKILIILAALGLLALGGLAWVRFTDSDPQPTTAIPRYDHVVVVVDENHSYDQIIKDSPYIASLTHQGANFTNSHALGHPSEPNYLMLFSGSNQGVTDDAHCAHSFTVPSLGGQLIKAGRSFTGYSEDLPSTGYHGCSGGEWVQRHVPWASFNDIPGSSNLSFAAFPTDYNRLPTVVFVTPNLQNDMHDGSIAQGGNWIKSHLGGYIDWAKTHNSLFILTFDEDDNDPLGANQITTVMVGDHVKVGEYAETINHYSVLRTLEDMYGLRALGGASEVPAIKDIWTPTGH